VYEIKDIIAQEAPDIEAKDKVTTPPATGIPTSA
jgi:hypothetical protein